MNDTGPSESEESALSPDEAFNALGNEARIRILQTLGEADGPLTFSELRDRIGHGDPGNFNYHLSKLEGHFIRKTEEGYELRHAGRRVVMTVLSGTVTDDPEMEPTLTDLSCWYCGAPIEVSFREERATAYCTECQGTYGKSIEPGNRSRLGYMYLPPVGIEGRTPAEVYQAGVAWGNFELLARAIGICLYCSAPLDKDVSVCEDHDTTDGLCEECDRRYAVLYHTRCTNCIFDEKAVFFVRLLANTDLRRFLIEHGIDPVDPAPTRFFKATTVYDEEVLSVDPFKARFTFFIDGDSITLTVDDDLNVA